MTYQMTQVEADNYALRMFNDDYWDKDYTPDVDGMKLLEKDEYYAHLELPIVLKTERSYVCEDDEEEYRGRPNAMDNELSQDDMGVITLPFTVSISYPLIINPFDELDIDSMVRDLQIKVKAIETGSLYDGKLKLSQQAHDHLIQRINEKYMVLDTFHQHTGLINFIAQKATNLLRAIDTTA